MLVDVFIVPLQFSPKLQLLIIHSSNMCACFKYISLQEWACNEELYGLTSNVQMAMARRLQRNMGSWGHHRRSRPQWLQTRFDKMPALIDVSMLNATVNVLQNKTQLTRHAPIVYYNSNSSKHPILQMARYSSTKFLIPGIIIIDDSDRADYKHLHIYGSGITCYKQSGVI